MNVKLSEEEGVLLIRAPRSIASQRQLVFISLALESLLYFKDDHWKQGNVTLRLYIVRLLFRGHPSISELQAQGYLYAWNREILLGLFLFLRDCLLHAESLAFYVLAEPESTGLS